MSTLESFQEMLRQLALDFNVGQIQKVVFYWWNAQERGFLLSMDNGEYWYATNMPWGWYSLSKYPPPIPSLSDLIPEPKTMYFDHDAEELNEYVKENGGGESHYLVEKDED